MELLHLFICIPLDKFMMITYISYFPREASLEFALELWFYKVHSLLMICGMGSPETTQYAGDSTERWDGITRDNSVCRRFCRTVGWDHPRQLSMQEILQNDGMGSPETTQYAGDSAERWDGITRDNSVCRRFYRTVGWDHPRQLIMQEILQNDGMGSPETTHYAGDSTERWDGITRDNSFCRRFYRMVGWDHQRQLSMQDILQNGGIGSPETTQYAGYSAEWWDGITRYNSVCRIFCRMVGWDHQRQLSMQDILQNGGMGSPETTQYAGYSAEWWDGITRDNSVYRRFCRMV